MYQIKGKNAANGFEAIKDLDSNADGTITSAEAIGATVRIWIDANGKGNTEDGELQTLNAAGAQSINIAYTTSTTTDAQGNQHLEKGSYTTSARIIRTATHVWFKADWIHRVSTEVVSVSEDIAALPEAGLRPYSSSYHIVARFQAQEVQG